MKLSSVLTIVLSFIFSFTAFAQETGKLVSSVTAQETIKWVSFEKAVELSQTEKRPIIMDVYTDWCGWCKKMDATTFANPKIAAYVNQYFYAVKFNAEQKESIKFREREYKFIPNGQRGYHELAAELLQGKLSYPTIVYLDKDINLIQPIPGFQTPQALEPIINYFGSDKYRSMKWEDFSAQFKSNL